MMPFTRPLSYLYSYKLSVRKYMEVGTISHPSWCLSFFCVLFQILGARRGRKRRRFPSSPRHYPFTSFKHCNSFHFSSAPLVTSPMLRFQISGHKTVTTKKLTNCGFNLLQSLICKRYHSTVAVSTAGSSRAGRAVLLCLV